MKSSGLSKLGLTAGPKGALGRIDALDIARRTFSARMTGILDNQNTLARRKHPDKLCNLGYESDNPREGSRTRQAARKPHDVEVDATHRKCSKSEGFEHLFASHL